MRTRAPINFLVFSIDSVMSKSKGKCVFCPRTDLTKSHIWPEWAQKVIPSTAKQYEVRTGSFHTYTPNTNVEDQTFKIKAGSVANRRPRNTCFECNNGWMRSIEEYARPYITALMLGDRQLLEAPHQYALAAFLSLVTTRIDISNKTARAVPPSDYQHLIQHREPGADWKIWIMRYIDGPGDDYAYRHFPMAMKELPRKMLETLSPQQLSARAEDCNTQVTTIVVGRLCAHIFSTTAYRDFAGYLEPPMCQIWPITGLYIDTGFLPDIDASTATWLHETIGRDRNPPDLRK
jgi:hypothetical protein